ncbi:MAG: hypothetical protein ACXAB9_11890 [Candidatus Thorarchaeota archaeon]|jgi:hypothetical protein
MRKMVKRHFFVELEAEQFLTNRAVQSRIQGLLRKDNEFFDRGQIKPSTVRVVFWSKFKDWLKTTDPAYWP